MRFLLNPLIYYPKPGKRNRLVTLLLVGLFLSCVLIARPGGQVVPEDYQKDPNVTTWLTKEKARQIMRYHGTNGIMVTEDSVYIKRDGRWICVYRDPVSVVEKASLRVDKAKGRS